MKNIILTLITLIVTLPAGAKYITFVDDLKKVVYYETEPILKAQLSVTEADEENWALLNISASYPSDYLTGQFEEIQKNYASYKIMAIHPKSFEKIAVLEIKSIQKKEFLNLLPSQYGPFSEATLILNKEETEKIIQAKKLSQEGIFKFSYQRQIEFKYFKKIPQLYSSIDLCHSILKNPTEVRDLIQIRAKIEQTVTSFAQYPDSQADLREKILDKCFIVPEQSTINSFRELMSLKIQPSSTKQMFTGFTYDERLVNENNIIKLETNEITY